MYEIFYLKVCMIIIYIRVNLNAAKCLILVIVSVSISNWISTNFFELFDFEKFEIRDFISKLFERIFLYQVLKSSWVVSPNNSHLRIKIMVLKLKNNTIFKEKLVIQTEIGKKSLFTLWSSWISIFEDIFSNNSIFEIFVHIRSNRNTSQDAVRCPFLM